MKTIVKFEEKDNVAVVVFDLGEKKEIFLGGERKAAGGKKTH